MEWDVGEGHLSVGSPQRLETMRPLYLNAYILIFDEPTSVLTPQEADDLFRVLRRLAGQGRTIIFITHKLREVFALAERGTVMRRGRVITTVPTKGRDPQAPASLIVGEQVERPGLQEAAERG